MLDAKFVLENPDFVAERIGSRGLKIDLGRFMDLTGKKNEYLRKIERLRCELNKNSKMIGQMKQKKEDASVLIEDMRKVSEEIKRLEDGRNAVDDEINHVLMNIPNLPHESVPLGSAEEDNRKIRVFGHKPEFFFSPQAHWEIGGRLGILDFERAAKITGSRFAVYMGKGARLERALIDFMLDIHTREKGYREVIPPFIANEDSLLGTGNLPKFEDDLFKLEHRPWYLIPTAEVPLTNLYRDEILDKGSLPLRYVACTPCFRSEAGSYGKDIRGLIRQHQFNKVELMTFSLPENSFQELEKMTSDAEEVLQRLGLHYRVVALCTGELGFSGAKTYDLELWMPHREKYLEISSCTNCTDFQARRANIRFRRDPESKLDYIHTLNGSGVALGRTVSAILESCQQKDGSVLIPEALRPYMDGLEKID